LETEEDSPQEETVEDDGETVPRVTEPRDGWDGPHGPVIAETSREQEKLEIEYWEEEEREKARGELGLMGSRVVCPGECRRLGQSAHGAQAQRE